jgi:hypothetical protein
MKAIKWLLMHFGPLVIKPQARSGYVALVLADAAQLHGQARYAVNKSGMVRLAEYSRDCLRELRAETGIQYDERSRGTLQLFRTQSQLDAPAKRHRGAARQSGVPYEVLDREGCIRVEPALAAVRDKFKSAACACPATRPATASDVHEIAGQDGRNGQWGANSASTRRDQGLDCRHRQPDRRRAHQPWAC